MSEISLRMNGVEELGMKSSPVCRFAGNRLVYRLTALLEVFESEQMTRWPNYRFALDAARPSSLHSWLPGRGTSEAGCWEQVFELSHYVQA
jgi:hypothetical protein